MITIIKRIETQIFPEDPIEPDEVIKKQLQIQLDPKELKLKGYVIYESDNDNLIGYCFYGWFAEGSERAKGNEMISFIEIQIDPKYRRKGIGGSVYDRFIPKLKEAGKKLVIINTIEPDGKSFLEKREFQFALNQPIYRAKFADINWNMIDTWMNEGQSNNPDTELRIYDTFPEDIVEEYSKTFTKTHEQIPRGELQMQDMEYTPDYLRESHEKVVSTGRTRLTAVALEKSGKVSGFTYLSYSPTREPIIDQGLTAVLEGERGRKLGKWLKAVMLLEAKSRYPNITEVQTDIATSNDPMISINE
ncbi:MAG: GNAT family N-acetyltransferase, partial [Candidatus Heimdallarchaeota archaeon]